MQNIHIQHNFIRVITFIIVLILTIGIINTNSSIAQANSHRSIFISMAHKMRYVSQLTPHKINSACEAGAMLMALSIKHKDKGMSLKYFVDHKIGWFTNSNHYNHKYHAQFAYDYNPWHHPASIYPNGLKRVARRMHANGKNITGANKSTIIHYLRRGDPIVVEAGYDFQLENVTKHKPSDHVMLLIGYHRSRTGREHIQYADPDHYNRKDGIKWGTWHDFWNSYNRPYVTGKRGLVVFK